MTRVRYVRRMGAYVEWLILAVDVLAVVHCLSDFFDESAFKRKLEEVERRGNDHRSSFNEERALRTQRAPSQSEED